MGGDGAEEEVVGRDDAALWKAGGSWRTRVREIRRGGKEVCLGLMHTIHYFWANLLRELS